MTTPATPDLGSSPLSGTQRPWAAIDPAIADLIRPTLPDLAEQMIPLIARELPTLGDDLAGPYGEALELGITQALGHFLTLLGADAPALDARLTRLYEGFGAREDKHGRTLDTLLAAYRWGARGAWARFSSVAMAAQVPTDQLVSLAEAIFAYVDELSSASTVGFAREHSMRAGQRDVRRQQLVEALVRGEAATSMARVAGLAAEAGWPLPERVAAALLPTILDDDGSRRPPMLPGEVLVAVVGAEAIALLPAHTLRRRGSSIARAVTGAGTMYVGTVRAPEQVPLSLAHARALAQLVTDRVVPGGDVVRAEEHLPELLLHSDPQLLVDLAERALAPLEEVAPARRPVLRATLRSWLAHQGDRLATAAALHVHPQTVSYRMTRLIELFGPALSDPRQRLAITLALAGQPD